jgi:hypothetical protein
VGTGSWFVCNFVTPFRTKPTDTKTSNWRNSERNGTMDLHSVHSSTNTDPSSLILILWTKTTRLRTWNELWMLQKNTLVSRNT